FFFVFFFQAEDGIRDYKVTGVQTCALPICRHLEVWYGIMGIGAICHTVNPRLFPEQIAWIINHAQDRVVITDLTFVPLLEKLARSEERRVGKECRYRWGGDQ